MTHRLTALRRHRRTVLLACGVPPLLGLVPAAPAAGARAAAAPTGWRASAAPFALTFLDHGRPVTGEAGGALAGPGGRLAYQVGGSATSQDGAAYHRLTDLAAHRPVPGGTAYTVATDEPGRTATVAVTRTPQGVRVRWSFTPSTGVTAVFEALTARGDEHHLGGSSAAHVDLRGHIRGWSPGKEGDEAGDYCQNQEQDASTFYPSSGGYGLYAAGGADGRADPARGRFPVPADQTAWAQDQEFMVGPDLLAAPVTDDRADADGRVPATALTSSLTPRTARPSPSTPLTPRSVRSGGHPLPGMTAAALRGAGQGWTVATGPFGGLLLKLRTRGGAAEVTIR